MSPGSSVPMPAPCWSGYVSRLYEHLIPSSSACSAQCSASTQYAEGSAHQGLLLVAPAADRTAHPRMPGKSSLPAHTPRHLLRACHKSTPQLGCTSHAQTGPQTWQAPCHVTPNPALRLAGAGPISSRQRVSHTRLRKYASEVNVQGIIALQRKALQCAQVERAQL